MANLVPSLGAEFCTFVQRPLWKVRAGIPETELAVIDPALKGWRDLVVSYLANVLGELQADVVQLTGIVYVNDANGLIEGKNSVQGYRQLIEDLREGLPPSMGFSVDAWDQVSVGYCDLAQLQLPGQLEIDPARPATMRFDDSLLPFVHPITAVLLRRDTTPFAVTGITVPDFAKAHAAWDFSAVALGALPHISNVDTKALLNPSPSLSRDFNQIKALESIKGSIDLTGWDSGMPQAQWSGGKEKYLQSVSAEGQTMQMEQLGEKKELIFRTDLEGHYDTQPAASMPAP